MDAPLTTLGAEPVTALVHLDRPGDTRTFGSCREYLDATADRFYLDYVEAHASMVRELVRLCRGLGYAAQLRLARRTYVDSFDLLRDGRAQIPVPFEAQGRLRRPLADVYPASTQAQRDDGVLAFCPPAEVEGGRTCIELELLGRGDVNGDGVGDLILFITLESGALSQGLGFNYLILTRLTPRGPLETVDVPIVAEAGRLPPCPGRTHEHRNHGRSGGALKRATKRRRSTPAPAKPFLGSCLPVT